MNLTIFTIDLDDNLSFLKNDLVSKVCLNRLEELIKNNTEHTIQFKIFTPRNKIVQNCMEEFKTYFNLDEVKSVKSLWADVIRMYILSQNSYYLYIDSDIYFKNLNFLNYLGDKPISFMAYNFGGLWCKQDKNAYNKILNYYRDLQSYGFEYIFQKYPKNLNLRKSFQDGDVWTNLNLNEDFEILNNINYFHFTSHLFEPHENIKFFSVPTSIIDTIANNPDYCNLVYSKNIKLICKDYPYDGLNDKFLLSSIIRYKNTFESESDFIKILKTCFPEKPVITSVDNLLKEIAP